MDNSEYFEITKHWKQRTELHEGKLFILKVKVQRIMILLVD